MLYLPGTEGAVQRFGALAEVGGALCTRGGADSFFAAVRAGGRVSAAMEQKVAAFGLTTVDHAVHLSLFTG